MIHESHSALHSLPQVGPVKPFTHSHTHIPVVKEPPFSHTIAQPEHNNNALDEGTSAAVLLLKLLLQSIKMQ